MQKRVKNIGAASGESRNSITKLLKDERKNTVRPNNDGKWLWLIRVGEFRIGEPQGRMEPR